MNDSITPPMARYGAVQPYLQQELLDVRSEGNILQQNNTSPHVNTVLKQSASCSIHVAPQKLQRRSKSTCCPATITTVTPTSAPNCQRNVVQLPARTHRNANRFRIKWLSNWVSKGQFSTCCVSHVSVRRSVMQPCRKGVTAPTVSHSVNNRKMASWTMSRKMPRMMPAGGVQP